MRADFRHRSDADDGLAGTTGQDDDAAPSRSLSASVERIDSLRLVRSQREGTPVVELICELDVERLTVSVAREILDRKSQLDEGTLI